MNFSAKSIRQLLCASALSITTAFLSQTAFAQDEKNNVIATINGQEYTEDLLRQRLAPLLDRPEYSLEVQYPQLLEQFLLEELIFQVASKSDYTNDPRVQEQVKRATFSFVNRFYFEDQLSESINEDALMAAYEARVGNGAEMVEINARHILVETEDLANDLIAQLDAGADFATLAKEHSTGPSSSKGGDLGYFGKGQMVPSFEEAAFALEQGAYSAAAVQTQFGFHIIKLEEKRNLEKPTFASIRHELLAELQDRAAQGLIAKLKQDANIERFDLAGNAIASPDQ